MPLYVVAITDRLLPPVRSPGHRYEALRCGRLFIVGERRAQAPVATDRELARQYAVVRQMAELTDALLPVRFGTLGDVPGLRAAVRRHQDVLSRALDDVRGRVQMTIRVLGSSPVPVMRATTSGRDYLEQRRKHREPSLPPAVARYLSRLQPYVAGERRGTSSGRLRATVHHLVDRTNLAAYRQLTELKKPRSVITTGPLPPFAFTPRLLSWPE